ncbi:hypothetical protein HYV11_00900 [Candidatus Dependentiae bacterium]|nr:hypothetical protein [Candidatus Dependentiae bacterium]
MKSNFIKPVLILSLLALSAYIFNKWYHPPQSLEKFTPTQEQIVSDEIPLVVVLMVKNEADFMEKTLEPFINVGLQGYLILDTGSTDETIERTKKLFLDRNIKYGYIVEQPFIDFATSRNYAMECAEQLFPNALFFFMIDAEWYTQNVPELIKYCYLYRNEPLDAFKILIHYKNKEYYVSRILKADKKIRFTSVVHEYAQAKTIAKLPKNIFVNWDDSQKGFEKSKLRWQKDIKLLLEQHKKFPNDLRTIYYIAQTYTDLKDLDNAIIWYKKRYENTDGWIEERLLSCQQLAQIYNHLNNWPQALYYYLNTYNLNQNRAEPLIEIAQHYLKEKDYPLALLFAQKAISIPYPVDAISVEPETYFDKRYDILSVAAFNLGEYEIAEKAIKKALEYKPNNAHFLKNLKIIQDQKNKNTK